MNKNLIYVPLNDYQEKCKAEAELAVVKRYLKANEKYGLYDDLRQILGMEVQSND